MASVTDTYFMTPRALAPVGAHVANGSLSSSVTLTPPATANTLLLQATGQNVRYTLDGTTPTATTGFRLRSDDLPVIIDIGVGMTVKVIEETATATIQYQWGRFN